MKNLSKVNLMWLVALLMLSGCSAKFFKGQSDGIETLAVEKLSVVDELKRVASDVREEIGLLRKIEQSREAGQQVKAYKTPEDGVLAERITLKQQGPARMVIKKIASMVGYNFQVVGNEPLHGVPVDVDFDQTPVFEVLENIGAQTGNHVWVAVDDEYKEIALVYLSE